MNFSGKRIELRVPAWKYPWFTVKALFKSTLLRMAGEVRLSPTATDDAWAEQREDLPASLTQFDRGELLKWKGIEFRVFKVVGNPMPAVILVPTAATHGKFVRAARETRALQKAIRRHVDS